MKDFPPDNAPGLLPDNTDAWYQVRIGLPRPDWARICEWIGTHVPEGHRDLAWCEATCDWLQRLADAFDKGYVVHESPLFLMLMSGPDDRAEAMLHLLEDERRRICRLLGEVAYDNYLGKPAALVLSGEDDYYSYVADYDPPEGHFGGSGAMFIHAGYGHIALPDDDPERLREQVAHETVHNCLMHLTLPPWLNEGLAITVGGARHCSFADWRPLGREGSFADALAHARQWWNTQTIQDFWTGRSFGSPDGDVQHFSYVLAAELTRKLSPRRQFKEFVLRSARADGGSAAAAEILGADLAQEVAQLLGPGEWRPRPEMWEFSRDRS